ncbi:TNT domain-containing protein [Arthrobacter methylotrophus]|uniref:TNT domain-containing protein n=1 Tax=Arthrobacter methylotrophus TaxID=121291 RepID=A0ABV5UPG9_9MICC
MTLPAGTRIDRFGSPYGRFTSPEGIPLWQRALPPHALEGDYSIYETTRDLRVLQGTIAPAFGQPGYGTQYVLPQNVRTLIDNGFLKEVGK